MVAESKAPKARAIMLYDLPGAAAEEIRGMVATSPSHAEQLLRFCPAIIAAGDDGCLTVWHHIGGYFVCDFGQYRRSVERERFKHLGAVAIWIRNTWPKLGR